MRRRLSCGNKAGADDSHQRWQNQEISNDWELKEETYVETIVMANEIIKEQQELIEKETELLETAVP